MLFRFEAKPNFLPASLTKSKYHSFSQSESLRTKINYFTDLTDRKEILMPNDVSTEKNLNYSSSMTQLGATQSRGVKRQEDDIEH